MEKYKNTSGKSGIKAYETGNGFIKVQFTDGSVYTYTNNSAGKRAIVRIKHLAKQGYGLNSHIGRFIKTNYESNEEA